jgi:serine/threonine protein kinase
VDETRPKMFGEYRVLSLIGTGGMARVYRCQHWQTERIVAVKVLQLSADMNGMTLFEREIRAMQQLQYPYIAPLYDYHLSPQLAYFVMPYFENTVADRLNARLYSPREAAQALTQLAHALDYAHSLGYVHCDLKPSNLMLDGRGQVYLADFGLTKSIGRYTEAQLAFGTPPYMAPELADVRTDVYALGVLLCEMLSGHRPFVAERTIDYFYLHRRAIPPAPSQLNNVPPALDEAVLCALRKAPAERPHSAGEFARLFQAAVERLSEADQRWNPPHSERPSIVLKPVKSGSGILSELNEQPTQLRRPEALAAQTVERATLPSAQARANWQRPLLIALGVLAVLLTALIVFLLTR